MPLTIIQQSVAQTMAGLRSPDSYLAGGAAIHLQPNSLRYSNDLDYFNDSEERVASAFAADRAVLAQAGFAINITLDRPGFIRAIVSKAGDSTKVEWVHDTSWRFMPTLPNAEAGYVMHPVDLAINKLLALVGREEPRDFLDTLYTHDEVLPLGAMIWAAVGKDPGFSPDMLLGLLRRRGVYRPEDFQRLLLKEQPDMMVLKSKWLAALEQAKYFISQCPPDEAGCLYYSLSKQTFVGDFESGDPDVVPHFGRPGGVLPEIKEKQ